jgi:hypothetical protein
MPSTNLTKFTVDDVDKLLRQFKGISISNEVKDDLLHSTKIPSGEISIPAVPSSFLALEIDHQETFVSQVFLCQRLFYYIKLCFTG